MKHVDRPDATPMTNTSYFVLRDTVHGDIHLTRDEGLLLDTREMQRLRGVKQLGLASLVYPGATHTRFEHSVGTLHMAQVLIDAVNRNARFEADCRAVTDDEARIVRAAALVHDVTHIPYGHNIEDQTGLLPRHDSAARYEQMLGDGSELGRELARQALLEPVSQALGYGGQNELPFLAQMISDTICSDLMDYLRRDAHYAGLNLHYDLRIANYFKIDHEGRLFVDCEKEGLVREDILSEILRMLQARYYFSERVYYHHAKIAAGAMIARLVETALVNGWIRPVDLYTESDESLLVLLRERFLERTRQSGLDDARRALQLLDRLRRRRLIKRVAVFPYAKNVDVQAQLIERFFTPGSQDARRKWEREREQELREEFSVDEQVILYCPNRRMQLKEAGTLIRFPGVADLRPLSEFRDQLPRIADLEDSYLRLWKFYVFTSGERHDLRAFLKQRVGETLAGAVDGYRMKS